MIHFKDPYWWLAALVVIGLLAFTYFYYRRTIPPLKKPWRIGLGVTRSLALVLLLLALSETLLTLSPEVADPPVAAGIVDVSGSMYADDGAGSPTDRAAELWETLSERLPPEVRADLFYVAESLLVTSGPSDSGGQATALGKALSSLGRHYESQNLSVVFLFSDGNNNLGADPIGAAGELGVPVIAIGVGRPDTGLAPSIVSVNVDEVVLANRPFTIRAEAAAQRPGTLHLRLLRGTRQIADQIVEISTAGQRVEFNFETDVPVAGIHNFRVEPTALPEAGKSFFVKALKEKTRVLLYGFRPDWEFSFLRRSLGEIRDCEIVSILRGPQDRNLLEDSPLSAEEWLAYDAIILAGPDERWLKSVWAPIALQVNGLGKGVMVLLGEDTFSRSSRVLPYPLGFVTAPPIWKRGEFPLSVDGQYLRHPLLRVEENPDESRRVFESFPPFTGIWDLGVLPEQATAPLMYRPPGLNTPTYRTIPLVWTYRRGGGKALVVNGGPLWRWSFNSQVEPDGVDYYSRFLSFAIRWLTVTEDLEKQRISADKDVYASGEPIRLRGHLYDDGYRFLSRASVVARVWPDSSSETGDSAVIFLPPGSGDFYEAELTGLKPGLYNFVGQAVIDADTLSMAGGKLKIELVGLEKSARGLDQLQMRQIAAESGGRYYHETEPVAVLDSLVFISRTYTTHREIEIWNQSWVLIAFLVLISGEWFFRKRRQLL